MTDLPNQFRAAETPPPRYALAAKVAVAITVALAVLVPATLSYGIPLFERPIENLTFAAGRQLDRSIEPDLTTTLDEDTLWVGPTKTEWDDDEIEYRSVTGTCVVRLHEGHLPDDFESGPDDHSATAALLRSIYTDGDQDSLTNAPTNTAVAFRSPDSGPGRTLDALALTTETSVGVYRVFKATRSTVFAAVSCIADNAESRALRADALLHIAVTSK